MERIWFVSEGRCPTSRSRTRCRTCTSSCASLLSATSRIVGRVAASAIAFAIIVLLRFDVGPDDSAISTHLVALLNQQAPEVVGSAARLHATTQPGSFA